MSLLVRARLRVNSPVRRFFSSTAKEKAGLVLGVYKNGASVSLTPAAQKFDASVDQKLSQMLSMCDMDGARQRGSVRVLYGLSDQFPCVSAVGLGDCASVSQHYNPAENIHTYKQNVREAVAEGVSALRAVRCSHVTVDECGESVAAAEGATLSQWRYDELKRRRSSQDSDPPPPPAVQLLPYDGDSDDWRRGTILAEGQNLARTLMETPANLLTPTLFCERVCQLMSTVPGVEVVVRERDWMQQQRMGALLAVARGSREEPRLLELVYRGHSKIQSASDSAPRAPLALVGKGVTFDSGGLSLKPANGMDKMRADMGGAACVAAAIYTAARLNSAVNLHAFIPLCENMPGGNATRPGDVVYASNGTSIQVDNTDAEGRLILADALVYAQTHKPCAIVDLATLTGAMAVSLGSAAAGVFSSCDKLWRAIDSAGAATGDRVWRMPLWQHYSSQIKKCQLADVNNVGTDRYGGACTAAAFLREFVSSDVAWMHVDIAGVMETGDVEASWLPKGMSGRPTRTLVTLADTFFQS